jgi:hypothetical protein
MKNIRLDPMTTPHDAALGDRSISRKMMQESSPSPSQLRDRAEDVEQMAMVIFQSDREAWPDYPHSWNELSDQMKNSYRRRARAVSRWLKGE